MANGKIEFSVGALSFGCEGETDWVVEQLEAFLNRIPELEMTVADSSLKRRNTQDRSDGNLGANGPSLVAFLRSTSSTDNQVKKFLATAEWLRLRGSGRSTTSAVVKALRENSQKGLSNPADCLYKNVGKGFCEKVGSEFFVTDDGRSSLGIRAE